LRAEIFHASDATCIVGPRRVLRVSRPARPRMWEDEFPQTSSRIIQLLRHVRERGIVLLHNGHHRALRSGRAPVIEVLEYWLRRWSGAGLQFVTVDDCAAVNL